MRRPGQTQHDHKADDCAELKSSAYQFAKGGLVRLFIWSFRRELNEGLNRYLTIGAAVAAWFAALALLAIANWNGLAMLRHISVYAVIGMPLLGLVAWFSRQQRDALAEEHGRESEAYDMAVEVGHQEAAKTVMQDDWVLDPPLQRPDNTQKPRFGRQGQS